MNGGGLAGIVAEVVLGGLDETGDGADVDDGAGVAGMQVAGILEKRQEGSGHEEALGHVRAVGIGPVFHSGVFVLEEIFAHIFGGFVFSGLCGRADAGIID